MSENVEDQNRDEVDFEEIVDQILTDYEVVGLTLWKEGVVDGGVANLTVYPEVDLSKELKMYEVVDIYGKECSLYLDTSSSGIDPLGDFLVYAEEISPEVLIEYGKELQKESVPVEEGLERVRRSVRENTEEEKQEGQPESIPGDVSDLCGMLNARYRYPIVRSRYYQGEPTVVIKDGLLQTNISIERDGLFGWEVFGKIAGDEVEFQAETHRNLMLKLDERLDRLHLLEAFLGIE